MRSANALVRSRTGPGQVVAAPAHPPADAGGRPELAEDLPQRAGPLPRGAAGVRQRDRRPHDVAARTVVVGDPAQLIEGGAHRRGVAVGPPAPHLLDLLGLDAVVDPEDVVELAVTEQRRGCGLGEAVDADHLLLARLDAADPLGLAAHEPALQLVDRLEGSAELLHVGQLRRGGLGQLGRLGLDHDRSLEDVVVLEQVGLEGQHLLYPQGPLLVPRAAATRAPRSRRAAAGPGPGRSWRG